MGFVRASFFLKARTPHQKSSYIRLMFGEGIVFVNTFYLT